MANIEVKRTTAGEPVTNSILSEYQQMINKIRSRAFELFQRNGSRRDHDLDDWLDAERELMAPLNPEVKSVDKGFQIDLSLPAGFEPKDLKVYTLGDLLVVKGEKVARKVNDQSTSTEVRSIFYHWQLPLQADRQQIKAELKNGSLLLSIAGKEVKEATSIPVAEPKAAVAAAV